MVDFPYEIILVDNASLDGSLEKLEHNFKDLIYKENLILVESSENKGFSSGNNIGFQIAKGDYYVLINSDAELTGTTVQKAVEYLEMNPAIGALSARVINEHGELDEACKRGFPDPISSLYYYLRLGKLFPKESKYNQYKLNHLNEYDRHNVDAISGAFMVIPRCVLEETGTFDETFFMYGEDLDLCFRIKEKGYLICYNPDLGNVIHYKGQSGKRLKIKTTYEFYRAMCVFYNKHYKEVYPLFVGWIIKASIWTLFGVKMTFGQLKTLLVHRK